MNPEIVVGSHEIGLLQQNLVERDNRRHSLDLQFTQGAPRPGQGLGAVRAGDDEFRHERVEGSRNGHARVISLIDTDSGTGGGMPLDQGARGGHEAAPGVLGVDTELDGVAVDLGVVVAQLLALGDAEHLSHQIQSRDLLGNRVLHLETSVDLQEGNGSIEADEELAGPRSDIPGLLQDGFRRTAQQRFLFRAEERRRCLLDKLLVPSLQ